MMSAKGGERIASVVTARSLALPVSSGGGSMINGACKIDGFHVFFQFNLSLHDIDFFFGSFSPEKNADQGKVNGLVMYCLLDSS